jgi:hypothetical protein
VPRSRICGAVPPLPQLCLHGVVFSLKRKHKNNFVWVLNVVSYFEGRKYITSVWKKINLGYYIKITSAFSTGHVVLLTQCNQ